MRALRLGWTFFRRDLRAGEIRLVFLALVLAVGSLTTVSFFVDRATRSLALEARQLLGGDLLLVSDHPFDERFAREAERRGLRITRSITFPSMVGREGRFQLADVKAVEPDYPLRGEIRVSPDGRSADAPGRPPAPGTVLLDERLWQVLEASPGTEIQLGDARLRVAGQLTFEPDRGAGFMGFAPRLLVALADLPATGLIQTGSRASWRLHLSGEESAVRAYRAWVEPALGRGERIQDLDNARPEVRAALDRAQRFLGLAAVLAAALGAVAVGLATRRFVDRHLDSCAVMRCFGATGRQVLALFLAEFAWLAGIGTTTGLVLGYAAQQGLTAALGDLVPAGLPAPGWRPPAHGLAIGLVLVTGFALPPLLRLRQVSTLRVLRREWQPPDVPLVLSILAGIATLGGLMLWTAGDVRLGLWVVGGLCVAATVLGGLAWLGLGAMGGGSWRQGAWRYGVGRLRRRRDESAVQIVALALGLTAMLLLAVARGDLLSAWQGTVPPDAPNRFVVNIQPDQVAAVAAFLREGRVAEPRLFPMVRGRLVAVNGRAVDPDDYEEDRAKRLVDREFNLSWTQTLESDNRVVAGRWDAGTGGDFSVEEGLAQTLGLKLGDGLRFDIAGNTMERRIASLRKVDWNSMRVNFFVLAPPGVLESFPASYVTSFHLAPDATAAVPSLVERFPNLTVIDVAAIVRQIQGLIGRVVGAAQLIFLFAMLAGGVVLFAAIDATLDERRFEMAVLRTLGARNSQLRRALLAEFAALGLIAGGAAGLAASGIAWALGRFVFQLAYTPGPVILVSGLVLGTAGVLLAGWLGARGVLRAPALESLRAGT